MIFKGLSEGEWQQKRQIIVILNLTYAECHIYALYAECCYAECHYTERHYAECRGAHFRALDFFISMATMLVTIDLIAYDVQRELECFKDKFSITVSLSQQQRKDEYWLIEMLSVA
jgi:hypothetical protein